LDVWALSPAVIKPRLTAGIDPTHRLFLGSGKADMTGYSTKSRHRAPHGSFMLCAIFFGHWLEVHRANL
jgi:hypothetical protein